MIPGSTKSSRLTAKQIAANLGLARSTVSMALRDNPAISLKTRERIRQESHRLHYVPNVLAQAMTTGRTEVFAFVAHNFEEEWVARPFSGLVETVGNHGFTVKIIQTAWDFNPEEVASICLAHCVSGVIASSVRDRKIEQLSKMLRQADVPLVALSCRSRYTGMLSVTSDDQPGIAQAVDHLIYLGHTRIGFIGGDPKDGSYAPRRDGYFEAMRRHGLEICAQHHADGCYNTLTIERVSFAILDSPNRPTALVCCNDPTAMIVIRTARSMGLNIPQDLSVIGFSNLAMGEFADPPLTTIDQSYHELGQIAGQKLLQKVNMKNGAFNASDSTQIALPATLLIRNSTASPPNSNKDRMTCIRKN